MTSPLVIVQARLSSTRLPGKVLQPFHQGNSILDIQLNTIKQHLPDYQVVIATTHNPADDRLEGFGRERDIEVFRGPEDDVLERFILCGEHFGADNIMRICSDNPFLMGNNLVHLILGNQQGADYFSYRNAEGIPAIKTHWGLFAELVKLSALKKVREKTDESLYHEHVTNFIYAHPAEFRVDLADAPSAVFAREDLRFTIDTERDFETARAIYAQWDKESLESLVKLVDSRSDWKESMNFGIRQFSK